LLTFTNSFSVFVAYTCFVLCFNLINLMLAVKTSASVYTSTVLKSSFTNIKEHTSKFCSLIVTSCFIILLKTAFVSVTSFITFRYYFLRVLCLLQTTSELSFTFTKTTLSIRASNSMSLFVMFVTIVSFYSLVCIVFRTASLCFISFRIFVRFFYFLSFIQVCSI
jgi:hypothetical protein